MGVPSSSTTSSRSTRLLQQSWKGKERAIDVGGDGRDGVVVSLALVGNGVYDA